MVKYSLKVVGCFDDYRRYKIEIGNIKTVFLLKLVLKNEHKNLNSRCVLVD